jgi:hypothetical protein
LERSNSAISQIKAIDQIQEMKTVGFLKEHDSHSEAKDLNSFLANDYSNESQLDIIVTYLENGIPCLDLMEWLFDGDTSIGPNSCRTDGIWIWPDYLSYYIKKYNNFKIDDDFLNHIIGNDYREVKVSKEKLSDIQKEYLTLNNSRTDSGTSLLK